MRIIDFQEFHVNLEQLIERLGPGESFIVSRDGVPAVMVTGLEEAERSTESGAGSAPDFSRHDGR